MRLFLRVGVYYFVASGRVSLIHFWYSNVYSDVRHSLQTFFLRFSFVLVLTSALLLSRLFRLFCGVLSFLFFFDWFCFCFFLDIAFFLASFVLVFLHFLPSAAATQEDCYYILIHDFFLQKRFDLDISRGCYVMSSKWDFQPYLYSQ